MIKKVVVTGFSHNTQCLITTSLDITFINLTISLILCVEANCLRSLYHVAIYQETIIIIIIIIIIIFFS